MSFGLSLTEIPTNKTRPGPIDENFSLETETEALDTLCTIIFNWNYLPFDFVSDLPEETSFFVAESEFDLESLLVDWLLSWLLGLSVDVLSLVDSDVDLDVSFAFP